MSDHDDEIELIAEELLRGIADDTIALAALRPTAVELGAALRVARSGDPERIARARQSIKSSSLAGVAILESKTRLRLEAAIWRIFELGVALVGRAT